MQTLLLFVRNIFLESKFPLSSRNDVVLVNINTMKTCGMCIGGKIVVQSPEREVNIECTIGTFPYQKILELVPKEFSAPFTVKSLVTAYSTAETANHCTKSC